MEFLQNGYRLDIPIGCFPLSTDSMLLSDFVRLPRNSTVLDLGSGCGTLGMLLCAKDSGCIVTGVELDEAAHTAALHNIADNALERRLSSICTDLRIYHGTGFHCCVSNPPYYTGGPASSRSPSARRDDNCTIEELMAAASQNLRYGGDFFLVHKPEKLAQLISSGSSVGLEAKRLRLIRHTKGATVNLILLQFRKGGKPGLVWEENFLRHPDGTPSDYYKKVYHL